MKKILKLIKRYDYSKSKKITILRFKELRLRNAKPGGNMKVLFVNGTTMQAVKEMQKVFAAENIDTEVIQLGSKPLRD